jgi:ABC-type phosphate transport system substrate-binding protein
MPKTSRFISLLVLALVTASPCFAHHMAVVVSKENGVTAVTSAQLGKIFKTELKKWPDGKNIALVLHRASTGELVTLRRLNKMSAQQWQAFLAEHKDSVKLVDTDEEVLAYVESTPGAVGLIDVRSITDRVTVVRVDGKVPMEDGYLPH